MSVSNSLIVPSVSINSVLIKKFDQNSGCVPNGKMDKVNQLLPVDKTDNEDATLLLKNEQKLDQISAEPVRLAPIVIKMQPTTGTPSPQYNGGVKTGDRMALDTDQKIIRSITDSYWSRIICFLPNI